MRALVIGSGGREHALAWKLAQEAEVFASPGNPGIAEVAQIVRADTPDEIAALGPDLVVVGPENPLVDGLADALRTRGLDVYGPGAEGARLEASKAFSKEIMARAGVPTAQGAVFHDPMAAEQYVRERYADGEPQVIKASGNALGKGVVVADDVQEASDAVNRMMVQREFGDAGATIIIEDRLNGWEFSLLSIVGDHNFESLPVAQDYKRAFDADQGPNTGGMGTYSPVSWVTDAIVAEAEDRIVRPVLLELRRQGVPYRGTLFTGVMLHDDRPRCLEFNVRFGDPETQTVVRRIGQGFVDALVQAATGEEVIAPEVRPQAAVTVVVASGGYPGSYERNQPISLGPLLENTVLFHAGTGVKDGQLVTTGGRVFGVSGVGATVAEARATAYAGVDAIRFEGKFCRGDIAA